LASVCRFHNPDVLLAFVLLKLLVVIVEISEFVWQDVGIRREVEGALAESFLHSHDVEAEAIFSGDFVGLWEVIDLLVFVQTLILV